MREMIKREKYIEPIREFYDSDLIKVITGIRRCGKSVILKEIIDEIKEKSDNIIFLDFEDTAILSAIPNELALIDYIERNRKKSLCYVIIKHRLAKTRPIFNYFYYNCKKAISTCRTIRQWQSRTSWNCSIF